MQFYDITADELRRMQAHKKEKEYLLVDVRQPQAYRQAHLPGAVPIPLQELPDRTDELPLDRDIVFYCRSGLSSRAAAVSIANKPEFQGKIMNLTGGILGWQGVLLPEVPRLHLFPPTDTQAESLLQAMSLERGAAQVYGTMQARFNGEDWAKPLHDLATEEIAHARLLYRAMQQDQANVPDFDALYAQLPDDLIEGGFSRENIDTELARSGGNPCQTVFELAMAIEYAAYDLYRSLAQRFRQAAVAEVFLTIAQAEKAHLQRAAEALQACEATTTP